MEDFFNGRRHVLRGTKKAEVSWTKGRGQKGICQAAQVFAIKITSEHPEFHEKHTEVKEPQLAQLVKDFTNIFEKPKSLPPHRSHDYKIILQEGTSPINVRPYRYPALQKDIIEQTVKEMLEAGIVRPSQSPFSSLIVLVKKKDGT